MKICRIACAVSTALIAGGCLSIPSPAAAAALAAAPRQESYFASDAELRELLKTLVERGESKALVLGLLEPDGRRRFVTYGDAGSGARPLSPRTIFETGSITKTFTAVILADMVRRGEVALDDPVAKFLPAGVTVPSRNGRQITLLDLATHRSGLPRSPIGYQIPDRANPYAQFQAENLYAFLSSYKLEGDIGAQWDYSNLGVGLLGHALVRASGAKDLCDLVRQRITSPLKMNMTGCGRAGDLGAWMAKAHNEEGEVVSYWNFAVLAGAGALNSNAEDMLTYLDANVGEPRSPIEAAMRDAHQPRFPTAAKGINQALGWDHRVRAGRTLLYKSGSTGGFAGAIGFDPATRAGVVVLANADSFGSRVNVVLQLLKGGRPEFRTANVPASQIEPLLGLYEFEGGNRRFFTSDGKLFTRVTGGQDMEVFPAGDDRFFYGPGTLNWFEVRRDPAGKHVMAMFQNGSEEPLISVRTGTAAVE